MMYYIFANIVLQFVTESEKRLIGDGGEVSLATANGTDSMDIS